MEAETSKFNVWSSNPFQTKNDVANGMNQLFEPIVAAFTDGGARVKLAASGASFSSDSAELEGFARPLWGIVPYVYGGGEFKHWELYRRGFTNGTNLHHSEYWGEPKNCDQTLVDIAAIGFALCFVPEYAWYPLTNEGKRNLSTYLLKVRGSEFCHNNWKFFRVIIDLGLKTVGIQYDYDMTEGYLQDIETMYLEDGWYGDGKSFRIDYYNAYAFHFYGIIYAIVMREEDPVRSNKYIEGAKAFAKQFINWFSDNGASLPYGRSLTYRFAAVAFWGILPCVLNTKEDPFISWGTLKELYLRNLQWWSKQPISTFGSEILSVGFSYPNMFMSERYNSPQSPYWAFKAFAPLMLPESHPFWSAEIEALSLEDATLNVVGMHISHNNENTIALVSGPWNDEYQCEKYSKFAYSTRYGFGVRTTSGDFTSACIDNMIGFSFNKRDFFVRVDHKSWIFEGGLYSEWSPNSEIEVKSWILQKGSYHLRIHEITNNASEEVHTREAGFPISFRNEVDNKSFEDITINKYAEISTSEDTSIMFDLLRSREPKVSKPEPNANIMASKAMFPQLIGSIASNTSVKYACAVYCQPKTTMFSKLQWIESLMRPAKTDLENLKNISKRVLCNI